MILQMHLEPSQMNELKYTKDMFFYRIHHLDFIYYLWFII